MKSCCFSGHRDLTEEEIRLLQIELDCTLRQLIAAGLSECYCGAARGFDFLAAQAVLRLKKTYPFLKLHLVLPCENQSVFWTSAQKQTYSDILKQADSAVCLQKEYTVDCMYARNRALIEKSDCLVCFLKKESGGTAHTVSLAAKKKKRIIPLGLNEKQKVEFELKVRGAQLDFSVLDDSFF